MFMVTSRPPLWCSGQCSGQSSSLQIQRSGFDSRHCQIFREVEGLEWGPLSLVSTTEELLGRNSSGSDLESREYGLRIRYSDHVALALPTSSGHSIGIVS
jgi:hypothetical protein